MKQILCWILGAALGAPSGLHAQCEPVSARVCLAGDDTTQVWVNGSFVGSKDYCNLGNGCDPDSLCLPVPLALLPGPQVCLAVETANKNPVMVFSSWELEVDCAGAKPFVVNSGNPAPSGLSLDWDPTGGADCGQGTAPPLDNQGRSWTDLAYQPASSPFTLTGMPVTANTWTAGQTKDALTRVVLPFISYDSAAAGSGPAKGCGILYWRQIAQLPNWIPTATPTVIFTPPRVFTPTPTFSFTPTRSLPPPLPWTATPTPRPRRIPTAVIFRRPRAVPTPQARRIRLQPTPTWVWRRPTPTPTLRPYQAPPALPPPAPLKAAPVPTWLPPVDRANTVVFQVPPVEIYVTFADGPGRYQLEVVDAKAVPLRMVFDRKVVGKRDAWVTWDGKNSQGLDMPPGQYFVVFYKDGKPLRSISVIRSGTGKAPPPH